MDPRTGLFISFEGIDGSGKSTQARLLAERISGYGKTTLLLREPGGTATGELIRQLLLSEEHSLTPGAELLLYIAARNELTEKTIRPALQAGKVVICDRYGDSTMAYQGFGSGQELTWIRTLNNWATGRLEPALTFLLDLPVETAHIRRGEATDQMEKRDLHYHQRVRNGFLTLAGQFSQRFRIIDACLPIREQADNIWQSLSGFFLQEQDGESP